MADETPPQSLDYAPPPRRWRLRRWLFRGGVVVLVLLIAAGLVWRNELRGYWDAGWKRYHGWRAERAFAAILAQDHGVPFGTVVYDSAQHEPVLQSAPKAVVAYERHQAVLQGLKPTPLPTDCAVILAGQVREPAGRITADVAVAVADGRAITFSRVIIWNSMMRSIVPRGAGRSGGDSYDIIGDHGDGLAFCMGKVTENPFEIVIPYSLDGEAGEIRGWLDENPGSGGGSNYSPPPAVRLIATHGWMVNNWSSMWDQQTGMWHIGGPERHLRGYIPEWTLHATDWKRGGAIVYAPDGRLLYWEKLRIRTVGDEEEGVVAEIEPPLYYTIHKKAVVEDPSDRWDFQRSSVTGHSPLVKFHDVGPAGKLLVGRLDGYAFAISSDGHVARYDLLANLDPPAPDPRLDSERNQDNLDGWRTRQFEAEWWQPFEHPGASGITLAGDTLAMWQAKHQRIGFLRDGSYHWQALGTTFLHARALAGSPDGSAVLIASEEPEREVVREVFDDGEVLEYQENYPIEALNAPPVLYRPDAPPRPVGPGRPAGAASFSPDGALLALADAVEDRHGLTIVDVATDRILLEAHALPTGIDHAPPAWSADGSRVAFAGHNHLYVADLDDGVVYQMFKPVRPEAWEFTVARWHGHQVALSPDGREIAFLDSYYGIHTARLPD